MSRFSLACVLVGLLACAPAAQAQPRRIGSVAGPVRLVPSGSDPITLIGLHSYLGTVELDAAGDGIVVENRLGLEDYLLGLQEVPLDWPEEALKAQAVAARTYALWTLARPRSGAADLYGFDICASTECQVYAGADVVRSSEGPRWVKAVLDTAGEAVTFSGEPILARYHSTSGGRTFDNSQVFTDEPDYPYLQGVPSPAERGAPLHRWRVVFPLSALRRMLIRSGWITANFGPLRDVRTVPSRAGNIYPDVLIRSRGHRLLRTAQTLREAVGSVAPQMFPSRYPSPGETTSGFLPETLPSNRVSITTRAGRAVVVGRGWGHGVGMSQWGARGLAEAGASYEDILERYYTGVDVAPAPGPASIRVGVAWGRSEITAAGAFRIVDGSGRTLVGDALGEWTFRYGGNGIVAVDPPAGFGLPLRVSLLDGPRRITAGERVSLAVVLSRPARVRATSGGDRSDPMVLDAGRGAVVWTAPRTPGTYRVQVEAAAGGAVKRTKAVEVVVASSEALLEDGGEGGDYTLVVVVLVLGALTLIGRTLAGKIRG